MKDDNKINSLVTKTSPDGKFSGVSMNDIYALLQPKTEVGCWRIHTTKRRGLIKGKDYVAFNVSNPGDRRRREYLVSWEVADDILSDYSLAAEKSEGKAIAHPDIPPDDAEIPPPSESPESERETFPVEPPSEESQEDLAMLQEESTKEIKGRASLIETTSPDGKFSGVDSRVLYDHLDIKTDYYYWRKRVTVQLKLKKGRDFVTYQVASKPGARAKLRTQFLYSPDVAGRIIEAHTQSTSPPPHPEIPPADAELILPDTTMSEFERETSPVEPPSDEELEVMQAQAEKMIPILEAMFGDEEVPSVDARQLHEALGSGSEFASWIKDQLDRCPWEKGQDYVEVSSVMGKNPLGGRPRTEYSLSLDMAKQIAMMSQCKMGFAIRKYFIRAEEAFRRAAIPAPVAAIPEIKNPVDGGILDEAIVRVGDIDLSIQTLCNKGHQEPWFYIEMPRSAFFSLMNQVYFLSREKAARLAPASPASGISKRGLSRSPKLIRRNTLDN